MKQGNVSPEVLRVAIEHHTASRVAAYGTDLDKSAMKAHQARHLPDMLRFFGFLLSCFVHERHHRLATKYAAPRKCTQAYEQGIMQNITVEQCQALEKVWWATTAGLINPVTPRAQTAQALLELGFSASAGLAIASSCKCTCGTVCTRDVVGVRNSDGALLVGEVVVLLQPTPTDVSRVIMLVWERDESCPTVGHTWRMRTTSRGMELHPTIAIELLFIYSRDTQESDVAIILLPPKLR